MSSIFEVYARGGHIMHLNIWRHKFVENHKFVEVYYFVEVKSQNCEMTENHDSDATNLRL